MSYDSRNQQQESLLNTPQQNRRKKKSSRSKVNYPINEVDQIQTRKYAINAEDDDDETLSQDSSDNLSDFSYSSDVTSTNDSFSKFDRQLIKRTPCQSFCLHVKLLLKKNYWLFRRNLKTTLTLFLLPIAFCLFILILQASAKTWISLATHDPP